MQALCILGCFPDLGYGVFSLGGLALCYLLYAECLLVFTVDPGKAGSATCST